MHTHRSAVVGAAAGLPALACLALSPLRDVIANTNVALGLVLLIVAAASSGIRSAGLAAALSSAASFDFSSPSPTTSSRSPTRRTSRPRSCSCWSASR